MKMETSAAINEIQQLEMQLQNENFLPNKLNLNYQIAKLWAQKNQPDKAQQSLDNIKNLIYLCHNRNEKVKYIFKIAKVQFILNPSRVPDELDEAENLDAAQRTSYSFTERRMLLPLHTKTICRNAALYHKTGNNEKANELIEEAKKCANLESRRWESLRNQIVIAKTLIKMEKIDEAKTYLNPVIDRIPNLRESNPQITMWTDIAKLLAPFDYPLVGSLVRLAELEFEKIKGNLYGSTLPKQQIKEAKEFLANHKISEST